MNWFERPLLKAIQKVVRPPTAKTRRKQLHVRVPMPVECFNRIMGRLQEGDCEWIERGPDGFLKPTKVTKALRRYGYIISKPSGVDRLFRFEDADLRFPLGGKRRGAYRRGLGAARLFLPAALQERHSLAKTICMPCGNVVVEYKQPWDEDRPPMLKVSFFNLTMDQDGHILWPTVFSAKSKAKLRKKVRLHLTNMIADPASYPVHPSMSAALVGTGSGELWTPTPRPDPEN